MTTRRVVRAALTEERSKAEIPFGFASQRRAQVPFLKPKGHQQVPSIKQVLPTDRKSSS